MSDPADRRIFLLDAEARQEFEAALDRPATFKPGLHALLSEPSPFYHDETGDPR